MSTGLLVLLVNRSFTSVIHSPSFDQLEVVAYSTKRDVPHTTYYSQTVS